MHKERKCHVVIITHEIKCNLEKPVIDWNNRYCISIPNDLIGWANNVLNIWRTFIDAIPLFSKETV